MLLILDKATKQVLSNMGTNSLFPDGNIPNMTPADNELFVRISDDSPFVQTILSAYDYSLELDGDNNVTNVIVNKTFSEFNQPTLDQVKPNKIAELDQKCNQTILAGFTSSALGVAHQYGFSTDDQANLTGRLTLINANPSYPEPFDWKTLDTGPLPHTKAQFIQVCTDGDSFKGGQIAKYWQLKAQVEAATTTDEVDAIIW